VQKSWWCGEGLFAGEMLHREKHTRDAIGFT